MANANVKEFTDANFQNEVISSETPVLVDFWAEWCGPCRAIAPMIDRLADRYAGKVKIGKVNIDHNQQVAGSLGIMAIPTLMVFKGGKLVSKVVGGMKTENELADLLEGTLK